MLEGGFGPIIQIAIGMATLIAAVVVPFRMGGWAMAAVARLAKMGALAGRVGAAGWLDKFGSGGHENQWRLTKGLRSAATWTHAQLYKPEEFMEARKRKESEKITAAKGAAAFALGRTVQGEALTDARVLEQIKEDGLEKLSYQELSAYAIKARKEGDSIKAMAALDIIEEKFGRSKLISSFDDQLAVLKTRVSHQKDAKSKKELADLLYAIGAIDKEYNEKEASDLIDNNGAINASSAAGAAFLKNNNKRKGMVQQGKNGVLSIREHGQAYRALTLNLMGARLDTTTGQLKDKRDYRQQFIMKRGVRYDKLDGKNQFQDSSGGMKLDEDGTFRLATEYEVAAKASGEIGDTFGQRWNRDINASAIIKNGELDDGVMMGMLDGNLGMAKLAEIDQMKDEGRKAFAEALSDPDKFKEHLASFDSGGRAYTQFVAFQTKTLMNKYGMKGEDALAQAEKLATHNAEQAKVMLTAFKQIIVDGADEKGTIGATGKLISDFLKKPTP